MITAKEAHKMTKLYQPDVVDKELRLVQKSVENAAKKGEYRADLKLAQLSPMTIAKLGMLGYKLCFVCDRVRIRWEQV